MSDNTDEPDRHFLIHSHGVPMRDLFRSLDSHTHHTIVLGRAASGDSPCQCRQCLRDRKDSRQFGNMFWPAEQSTMIVCSICGNKRCPHAADHRHACTGSNEPGQTGST